MVRMDVDARRADLAGMQSRAGRLGPVWPAIGEILRGSALRNFRQGGWWPAKWDKSARVKLQGGRTLVASTILRTSVHVTPEPNGVSVGTDVLYAGIHQYGGVIRPKRARALHFQIPGGDYVTVQKVTIPARPFLPVKDGRLNPGDVATISRVVQDHIRGES